MNAPVQIRKPDTVERLRRLAEIEGKTITELVDEMVRERTPARLNLGACFAYALAKELDAPLL